MGIIIVTRRRIPKGKEKDILGLIEKLRTLAETQAGYISDETWKNYENQEEHMFIREWESLENWHAWMSNKDRIEIQAKIEERLNAKTDYSTYQIVQRSK